MFTTLLIGCLINFIQATVVSEKFCHQISQEQVIAFLEKYNVDLPALWNDLCTYAVISPEILPKQVNDAFDAAIKTINKKESIAQALVNCFGESVATLDDPVYEEYKASHQKRVQENFKKFLDEQDVKEENVFDDPSIPIKQTFFHEQKNTLTSAQRLIKKIGKSVIYLLTNHEHSNDFPPFLIVIEDYEGNNSEKFYCIDAISLVDKEETSCMPLMDLCLNRLLQWSALYFPQCNATGTA